jgi:hypothetical protein
VRLRDIGCRWPLCVTVFAVIKTIFGAGWNSERHTKAIALYIGAAAKWAWIQFHVSHVPGSVMFGGSGRGNIEGFTVIAGRSPVNSCAFLLFNLDF